MHRNPLSECSLFIFIQVVEKSSLKRIFIRIHPRTKVSDSFFLGTLILW